MGQLAPIELLIFVSHWESIFDPVLHAESFHFDGTLGEPILQQGRTNSPSYSLTIVALLPFRTFSFNALRVSTISRAFSQML